MAFRGQYPNKNFVIAVTCSCHLHRKENKTKIKSTTHRLNKDNVKCRKTKESSQTIELVNWTEKDYSPNRFSNVSLTIKPTKRQTERVTQV